MNQVTPDLLAKLQQLPPQRMADVEDLIDSLRSRDGERGLARAAAKVAEPAFAKLWKNPEDAAYDRLRATTPSARSCWRLSRSPIRPPPSNAPPWSSAAPPIGASAPI